MARDPAHTPSGRRAFLVLLSTGSWAWTHTWAPGSCGLGLHFLGSPQAWAGWGEQNQGLRAGPRRGSGKGVPVGAGSRHEVRKRAQGLLCQWGDPGSFCASQPLPPAPRTESAAVRVAVSASGTCPPAVSMPRAPGGPGLGQRRSGLAMLPGPPPIPGPQTPAGVPLALPRRRPPVGLPRTATAPASRWGPPRLLAPLTLGSRPPELGWLGCAGN